MSSAGSSNTSLVIPTKNQQKDRFLDFVAVVERFAAEIDKKGNTQKIKDLIQRCNERCNAGEPGYESVTSSILRELPAIIPNHIWNQAAEYLVYLDQRKYCRMPLRTQLRSRHKRRKIGVESTYLKQLTGQLTPEVIGQIALYLPLGTRHLMTLLLSVGPTTAAVVRRMYATRNSTYFLWYCLTGNYNDPIFEAKKPKLDLWMKENATMWQQSCKISEGYDFSARRAFTVKVEPEELRDLFLSSFFGFFLCDIKKPGLFGRSVLLSVGDISLIYDTFDENGAEDGPDVPIKLHDMRSILSDVKLEADGKVSLRCISELDLYLSYPPAVCHFSLLDILKQTIRYDECLCESRYAVSPLSYEISGKATLAMVAARRPDKSCFQYLLTQPGVGKTTNVSCKREDGRVEKLIHVCLLRYSGISLRDLEILAHRSNTDVNALDDRGYAPLHKTIGLKSAEEVVSKARILIAAGADPHGELSFIELLRAKINKTENVSDKKILSDFIKEIE